MKRWLCALALACAGGGSGAADTDDTDRGAAALRAAYAAVIAEKGWQATVSGRESRTLNVTFSEHDSGFWDAMSNSRACETMLSAMGAAAVKQMRTFGFTVLRLRGHKEHVCAL